MLRSVNRLLLLPLLALLFIVGSAAKSTTDYFVYLQYERYDTKTDTYHLIVSEVINYDDWKNNSVDLRKKFAVAAASEVSFEVWQPGIKAEGISESVDETKSKAEAWIKSNKTYYEKHTVKAYRINVKR